MDIRVLIVRIVSVAAVVVSVALVPAPIAASSISPGSSRVAPGLAERAAEEGAVRVIVELQLPFVAEGKLPGTGAVARQRESIATTGAAVLEQVRGTAHQVVGRFITSPHVVLEVGPAALRELTRNPLVATIHADRVVPASLAESVPLVEADKAWNLGKDGAGRAVAVLDSGIAGSHPALAGKVIGEACFSGDTYGNFNGTGDCPNNQSRQFGTGAGVPCTYSSQCDHGTHVAGIAAANHPVYPGVARGASLVSVQIFHRHRACISNPDPAACSLTAWRSDIGLGLEWVYLERANFPVPVAAANLSLGAGRHTAPCDGHDPYLTNVVANLRSVGIATIASAANDGYTDALRWPACISSVISVGATDKSDRTENYSNSASFLSLLAPGSAITSSVPGGGFALKSGTSMAAPHVAGAWAIIKQAFPAASVASVLARLQSTGVPITDPRNGLTKPRIRLHRALQAMGMLLFVSDRDGNNEIYTMNPDGTEQANLTNTGSWEYDPAWSPDRTKIAFSDGRIWVMNADGSNRTAVTSGGFFDHEPAWSPSGNRLGFTRYDYQQRTSDIYAVNLDGSGLARLTTEGKSYSPDWSPNGSTIAFTSTRDGPYHYYSLYTMSADGAGQTRLTQGPSHVSPKWSPDGSRILFNERGVGIYTVRPDGTGRTLVLHTNGVEHATEVVWSPLGDQIAFDSVSNQGVWNEEIYKMSADGTGRTRLTNQPERDYVPDW